MEYKVKVKEILEREVVVEAKNLEEALDKVKDAYYQEDIVLDYNDCTGYEIYAEEDKED